MCASLLEPATSSLRIATTQDQSASNKDDPVRLKMSDPAITPPPPPPLHGNGDGDGDYTSRSLARAASASERWWSQIVIRHHKNNIQLQQRLDDTLAELTALKEARLVEALKERRRPIQPSKSYRGSCWMPD
jgi:hypothetical protein